MVTIGLCCIIWIISIDKIRTILAEQQKSINPTWPVLLLAALAIVSTCLAIGLNILNWISDQLWTRGFFYFWLALIFSAGIGTFTVLVVQLTNQVGRANLSNERHLWYVVAFAVILGCFAVPLQLKSGISVIQDKDKAFFSPLPEDVTFGSKFLIHLQGIGLLVSVWYAWSKKSPDDSHGDYSGLET